EGIAGAPHNHKPGQEPPISNHLHSHQSQIQQLSRYFSIPYFSRKIRTFPRKYFPSAKIFIFNILFSVLLEVLGFRGTKIQSIECVVGEKSWWF
ncbi:hypothetical protein PanWU01x14_077180, partial [Parasponia andersonii]